MAKKIFKIFLTGFLIFFSLTIAFFIAVRYPSFQTWLAHKATDMLSKSLKTKVYIERVEIQFFNKADLINFYIEDYKHDTLISAKEFRVNFKIFDLLDKRIEVSKIFLNEGSIYLHRDSIGQKVNLTELINHFKSTNADIDTAKSPLSWHIDLHELDLLKTDFHYLDEKAHSYIKVFIPTCEINLNKLSIDKRIIDIESVVLDRTDASIDLMKRVKTLEEDSITPFHFMTGGLQVKFKNLAITNTHFRMDDHNNDTVLLKGIDFKHLLVSDINLFAENGTILGDTILTTIRKMSAKERSGFELQNLTTEARVSVNEITLNKLHLITPYSEIKNYLSFHYNTFSDFKDFLNKVKMKVNFTGTFISLKDLGYFIKNLDKVTHNKLTINGEIDGKVCGLKGKGIEIRTGTNTTFKGDFYARGLPNIYETSLNLRIKRLATTIEDLKKFYPVIKFPGNLNNLGLIYYTGSLDGFLTDFVSKGKFVTDLGTANTDVNFKYDKKNNKAFYKGDLALNEFELGKFFTLEKSIGKVSLQTKITGGGLTLESLKAELDGNISSISILGYDYRNVKVDGFVLKKSFNGSLNIHDAFLDMDFNGKADLANETPEFNFSANIRKALLKNLNLTKEDFRISGKVTSDFKGGKIDDVIGKIELNDMDISRDTIDGHIKYFTLNAKLLSAEKKEIKINSDFAEGEMEGNFTLKELPKALVSFAKYTFTKDYVDTATNVIAQDFSADLRIYEPGNLTQIIHPKFLLIRNSHVHGTFNSVDHQVEVTATVPEIKFDNYNVLRTDVYTHFKNGDFDFRTSVDKVYIGDSLMLDTVNVLSKTLENDDVRFDVMIADKRRFNYANVTAFLTPQRGKAVFHLEPSDIKLGNNYWHFDADNSIFIENKKIITRNLVFRTEEQALYISSYLKNDTSTSFKLTLDNTDIGDFTGIFASKMKDLHGAVNGKLVVEDVFYKPNIYADLVVNEFTLGNELIGDINVDSRLDESGKNVLMYASVKSINNFIEARGTISFADKIPSMKINVDAPRLGLNFLNYKFFTEKYVKNCRGYAVVNATIAGPLKKPLLTGSVELVDDTVTVSFLNTTYHLDHQKAILDEHGFSFPELKVYDERNKTLFATGRINHESFRQFALDLKVRTDNAQFINTTAKQSPNFYGVAYGQGNITFSGDINSPTIKAYARTLPGTYCRLPVNSSYEINRYGFYKFVDPNAPKTSNVIQAPQLKLNGVHFILDLEATSDARMDIILDPIAGDILTTYGNGNLKIEIPKVGNTTMYGNYEIERGNYLFTLQNIVNKRLEITKGGTINFNGEVYKAGLGVDAVYEVRTSIRDLFDEGTDLKDVNPQTKAAAQGRVTVKLLMHLTGVLERPTIGFDFQVMDPDPVLKSYVEQKFATLKINENEMNKQVFSLLVMNRFFPTTSSNTVSNYIGGAATNTVSEFLSSQLSNYLGNLLDYTGNDALQNLDFNIGYRQYDQTTLTNSNNTTSPTGLDTRRELQLALQQRLLNNRLTINAGGNFDFGNSTSIDSSKGARGVIPTGDFQIQYALTADGRWRAKAFNRTNYDYFNSRNSNRTGIGISYSQEFDKPSELFRKPAKKKKAKTEAKP